MRRSVSTEFIVSQVGIYCDRHKVEASTAACSCSLDLLEQFEVTLAADAGSSEDVFDYEDRQRILRGTPSGRKILNLVHFDIEGSALLFYRVRRWREIYG